MEVSRPETPESFNLYRARTEVQKFAKEGKTEERVLADDWLF